MMGVRLGTPSHPEDGGGVNTPTHPDDGCGVGVPHPIIGAVGVPTLGVRWVPHPHHRGGVGYTPRGMGYTPHPDYPPHPTNPSPIIGVKWGALLLAVILTQPGGKSEC